MGEKLTLPLKAEYFDAIKAGAKPEEFRLVTPFWRKRIEGRIYTSVVLTKGYPKASDTERRLEVPWLGYRQTTLTHPQGCGPNCGCLLEQPHQPSGLRCVPRPFGREVRVVVGDQIARAWHLRQASIG